MTSCPPSEGIPVVIRPRNVHSSVALASIGILGFSMTPAVPAHGETTESGHTAFSGTIAGGSSDVDYIAYVHLNRAEDKKLQVGEDVTMLRLPASAVRAESETFTIEIDPTEIPAKYMNSDGTLSVDLVASSNGQPVGSLTGTARAVSDAEGDYHWMDPMDPQPQELANDPAASSDSQAESYYGAVAMGELSVNTREARNFDGERCAEPEVSAETSEEVTLASLVQSSKRDVIVGTTYTAGGNTARVEYSAKASTSYGVATSLGGWSASGTRSSSSGYAFYWPNYNGNRAYYSEVIYGKYRIILSGCAGTYYYKWQPRYETGGTFHRTPSKPSWNYCSNVDSGRWIRNRTDGADWELGSGVKISNILGFNLVSSRSYGVAHKSVYNIAGSKKKLCGKSNYPAVASRLAEYLR